MVFTVENLLFNLQNLPAANRYLIAYSGGLDSTVLLHAVAVLQPRIKAEIQAVHIHHGLQAEADEWVEHCRVFCVQLGIPCSFLWVDARPQRGESPEAAARRVRYTALQPLVRVNTCLLTAHHQDDQAETLVLQLLRGAGPVGLAAMPPITVFNEGYHARPLLEFSRAALLQYATKAGLRWTDDPSNRDIRYDRNFIRRELMPLLSQRWPSVTRTIARVAKLQAEVSVLASTLAELDNEAAAGSRSNTLSVSALKRLTRPRRNNLLRYWIRESGLPVPTSSQIGRVRKELLEARQDSTPCLHWPGGELRRYRDDLYAIKPLAPHDSHQVLDWNSTETLLIPNLDLMLDLATLKAQGLMFYSLPSDLSVRFRVGGERCRPRGRKHHHALKKLFQEHGVPPWERARIPLIYSGERLVAVWGYWICE